MSFPLVYQRPEFGKLWLAQLIAFIGDGIFQIAMVMWLIQKTNSGTLVGLIISVSFLPAVLIGPFAGTLADRLPPKVLLIGADVSRGLLLAIFAGVAGNDLLEVWHLFLICSLLATAGVFHSPTTLAVIPRLVSPDQIDGAMALHTVVRDLSKLIGPALGGFIVARWSVPVAFACNAFALFFSAACIAMMSIPPRTATGGDKQVLTQLWEGLAYVRRQDTIFRMLSGFAFLNLFAAQILVLLPLTVMQLLLRDSVALGFCEGALALGSVAIGFFFVQILTRIPTSKLFLGSMAGSGVLFLVFAGNVRFWKTLASLFAPAATAEAMVGAPGWGSWGLLVAPYPTFIVGLFLLGGCFAAVNIAALTIFQKIVAPDMKGRFFSLVEALSYVSLPLASALAGYLADHAGIPVTYVIGGVGLLILTWRFSRIPGLTSFDQAEAAAGAPSPSPDETNQPAQNREPENVLP
ncbi:MAG TPA: MFS transporter [Candidatus Ozemobacteraceae bacterium]|nr:MFS transporter [Candidatus Ozemobacteraceae bacterium]